MKLDKSNEVIEKMLSLAGIKLNGEKPWDIKVHNKRFYRRILAGGSLALGESYMDGWWDCEKIDEFINRILRARLSEKVRNKGLLWNVLKAKVMNMQKESKVYEVGKKHYDVGNDLYMLMLDKRMTYTCGYWRNAKNLDSAQEAKLDLVCKKIGLKKGMKVLDIGCGWGSYVKYAAEKYGAKCVGITISKEQVKLARKICKGLPIEIRLQDYRKVEEKFDRVISLGMFEHVGYKNYRTYMNVVHKCLKPNGLFLLQTIGRNKPMSSAEPWINKYIFPNGILPSAKQITTASEGLFILEDWHSFGHDYDKTLMAWYSNFEKNWNKINKNYNERFCRMWIYFLLIFAGAFRSGNYQLWQIVFSKEGVLGGYESMR